LLSFHYLHAQRSQEAWSYSLQAAAQAKGIFANAEAAEYFERAIAAGRRLPTLTPGEIAGAHEGLGDARNLTGSYVGAASAYRASRRQIGDDVVAQARLLLKLARVEGWLDRYTNALRWITRGIAILDGFDGPDASRQRAELFGWYGRFCQEGGKHRQAIKWCTQAVEQAEAVGDKETTADALRIIDWAKMDLGQLEDPENWERALLLFEEIEDLPGRQVSSTCWVASRTSRATGTRPWRCTDGRKPRRGEPGTRSWTRSTCSTSERSRWSRVASTRPRKPSSP
jgi:tetratricopeptide (TPR) repeat protein